MESILDTRRGRTNIRIENILLHITLNMLSCMLSPTLIFFTAYEMAVVENGADNYKVRKH